MTETAPKRAQRYVKIAIPWLDRLPWIPYEGWMWIPPGFEVVKKSIVVNRIKYEVDGRAKRHPDGVRFDVKLYRDNAIVFSMERMFSGHSCIECPPGKSPMAQHEHTFDPPIEADRIAIIATDIEEDFQYILVNNQRFRIPTAGDNEIVVYNFDLSD